MSTYVAAADAEMDVRRVGGYALVVGGVLSLVGNLAHPRYANDDDVDIYRKVAHSTLFEFADAILIVGLVCVLIGLVFLARSLRETTVTMAARVTALVGGTIAVAQFGLELYGYRQEARLFASVPSGTNQVSAFWATSALDHLNSGLFDVWTMLFLGVTPLLLSFAMRRTFATWLAVVGAVGGAVCLVVGFANLFRQDQGDLDIPFLVGSLLVTVWILVAGFLLISRRNAGVSDGAAV
jgi:hypothetical protein